MKLVKQIGYKLIVVMCIVMTFCCFIASTPVEASKVNTSDFYYSGTMKGSYTIEKGFLEKLIGALGEILDFLVGLAMMGVTAVFIGWTALLERCLTWILEGATGENVEIESVSTTNITSTDNYITLDAIFFNRVPLLDINVFDLEVRDDVTATGKKITSGETTTHHAPMIVYTETVQGKKNDFYASSSGDSFIVVLKKTIASWYYTFRVISIMIMLILLVYIGIKIAIQSSATEKALYKRVLVDWLVGMILVFSIHYIMIFIIQFNELLVDTIVEIKEGASGLRAYEYGLIERAEQPLEEDEMEESLYEEVKTRAYDPRLSIGLPAVIMYMVLVYYAWKYTFIYLKRYLTVAVLVMMAPFVALSYAFNKVKSGKAVIFSKWLKEFFFIVILQSIHALMYVVFVDTALQLALSSISGILMAFVMFNFMCKAEGIFRKIFGISGKLTDDTANGKLEDIGKAIGAASLGVGASKAAVGITKTAFRATTKPLRMAGNAAFGKYMENKANKEAKKKENGELTDGEKYQFSQAERQNKLKLGEVAKNIKSGKIQGADKISSAILALKNDIPFTKQTENGTQEVMSDEEYVATFLENSNQYAENYDKLTTKRALAGQYIKGKWKEIMDPFQYVEKLEGEQEKYRRIKTEREFGTVGKKTDSVGMRLAQKASLSNILGLNKKSKEALKKQTDFIKEELLGFGSLLLGLPMLVANPAVGTALLAKGIHSTSIVFSREGKIREKNFKGIARMPDGKYQVIRFEGSAPQTIAIGAQAVSRETIQQIEKDKSTMDANVVNIVKTKHPKLYSRLATVVGTLGTSAAITAATTVAFPITVTSVAGGVLTGAILNNRHSRLGSNAYMALQDTLREARKTGAEEWKQDVKSTDAFLDRMATAYFVMEADKQSAALEQHTKSFEEEYLRVIGGEIDQMSDAVLRRETGYEDDIEVIKTNDGRIKLSGDSERKIIDNAIIEVAQKNGKMNMEDFELSDNNVESVAKSIQQKLVQAGVISKDEAAKDVIDDLKSKIKDRKTVLDKEKPRAVEEKIADEAIIETMREQNITDPKKVKKQDVMAKVEKKVMQVTEETSSVASKMQAQKPNGGNSRKENDSHEVLDRIEQTVSTRQEALAERASKPLDKTKSDKKKKQLKKQKAVEVGARVLETEERLSTDTVTSMEELTEPGDTDSVIKLLELQTKMYQDKQRLQKVEVYSKKERRSAYKAQMFSSDGSIRADAMKDGSRIVTTRSDGTRKSNSSRDGSRRVDGMNDGSRSVMSTEDVLKSLNAKLSI